MKPTVGRIVHVEKIDGSVISNGAMVAPAIVTQCWDDTELVNATMFAPGMPAEFLWSIHEKGKESGQVGGYVWFWPPRAGA